MAELGLWRSYGANSTALATNVTLISCSIQNCAGKPGDAHSSLRAGGGQWSKNTSLSAGQKRRTDAANGSRYSTAVSVYNCIKINKKLTEVTAGRVQEHLLQLETHVLQAFAETSSSETLNLDRLFWSRA